MFRFYFLITAMIEPEASDINQCLQGGLRADSLVFRHESSELDGHNSRTNRGLTLNVVDLAVIAVSACQDFGLIVTFIGFSARMASPVVTLRNECRS